MPEKSNKLAQRWNPGSASATLAEAAAATSSSNPTTVAKNPSAKNDTFVSEGSVKDRLSMWGSNKETKKGPAGNGHSARKVSVDQSKAKPAHSAFEKSVPIPSSSSSHSISSKKEALLLSSSSDHSANSSESLTGGSFHRERLAAWGKATQSSSQLSGHGVALPKKASDKSTKLTKDSTGKTDLGSVKPSRGSLMASSQGAKSMSSVTASQGSATTTGPSPSDMPVVGLSVRDRMKSWGKPPAITSTTVEKSSAPKRSTAITSSLDAPAVQLSESTDTNESLSKQRTRSDQESTVSSSASSLPKEKPSFNSPSPFSKCSLKKITPPQEDKHKRFSGTTLPSVDLKKVARPVEDKHKKDKEQFLAASSPVVGLKKGTPPVENDKNRQTNTAERPSLYSATSLRNVGKPKEDKWKDNSVTMQGRPSLYSSVSLRTIEKPKEGSKVVEENSATLQTVTLKSVGVPAEDKWKINTEQKVSEETASTCFPTSKLRTVSTQKVTGEREVQSSPSIHSSAKHRNIGKPKEDKWWKDAKHASNGESTLSASIGADINADVVSAPEITLSSSTASSLSVHPDMPPGEKTKEVSPVSSPVSLDPVPVFAAPQRNAKEELLSRTPELTFLDELPMESPADAPKVPPSPLEVLVKESVFSGKNKLLMLMSSMSGRQDQKTAQDRALTILNGLNVGPNEMELVDGADPVNKERRNELFAISGIRAQYPQFFLVNGQGKTEFLGDWESFEMMNDSGHLGESMNLGSFEDPVEKGLISVVDAVHGLLSHKAGKLDRDSEQETEMAHLTVDDLVEERKKFEHERPFDDDGIFDIAKGEAHENPLVDDAAMGSDDDFDHPKQFSMEGCKLDKTPSQFADNRETKDETTETIASKKASIAEEGIPTSDRQLFDVSFESNTTDPPIQVKTSIAKHDAAASSGMIRQSTEAKGSNGDEDLTDQNQNGLFNVMDTQSDQTGEEVEVVADLPTPKKSGSGFVKDIEESLSTRRSSPITIHANQHLPPSLGDYFERSYSSSSSEASEGGWTEVHDQSESSDTGHSVQTNGTLGSAIIVDATLTAKRSPLNNAKQDFTPAESNNNEDDESCTDGLRPGRKPSSPKNKKKATDATLSPTTPPKKKKGKKKDYAKAHVSSLSPKKDSAQGEPGVTPPSKKKKKKKSVVEKMDKQTEPKTTKKEPSVKDAESSPSKKKKTKKTKCDNNLPQDNDCKVSSPTTLAKSPAKKKKKKKV